MRARFLPLIAGVVLLTACGRPAAAPPSVAARPIPVRTARVTADTVALFAEVPATIRPAERAVIAARLTGTIATLPWGLGQSVHAGDLLLTLSAPEAEARVRQAQAQLAEAGRAAERERTLVAKGVNPPDTLRDAEDRLRFAEATLAEAEAVLAFASVRAPFDGVVTAKHVLTGDLATPGLPLLVLESSQHLRAEGTIPERLASNLHIGDSLSVTLDDAAVPVAGRIEELSSAADAVSRSLLVRIALPAGPARSGQFARLQVPAGEAAALVVPPEALSRFGQIERVFVVADGRATLRLVRSGRGSAAGIELLSGVNAGETVVLAPPAALRDGSPVTIQP